MSGGITPISIFAHQGGRGLNGGGLGLGCVPVWEDPVADLGQVDAGGEALGAFEALAVVEVGDQFALAVVKAAFKGEDAEFGVGGVGEQGARVPMGDGTIEAGAFHFDSLLP